jgi:translation initiation factor IF-2
MFPLRVRAVVIVAAVVSLAAFAADATASPARRLARRGVLPAPPPGTAVIPPGGPLRPNPLLAVPIAPGGPAIVVGPAGRVRRRLAMPADVAPAPVVTVTPGVGPAIAAPPLVKSPPAAAVPAQPLAAKPAQPPAAAQQPAPVAQPPAALAVEPIPAPLPQPRATAAGGVVPAGGELEIPDGTRSVLVPAGNEQPAPAGR